MNAVAPLVGLDEQNDVTLAERAAGDTDTFTKLYRTDEYKRTLLHRTNPRTSLENRGIAR